MSELDKPSRNEDEYFVRLDAELLKQRRAELDAQRATAGAEKSIPQCPHGHGDLIERHLEGVVVDICPECGGMWLDAGELDLIRDAQRSGLSRFVDGIFGKGRE